VERFEHRAFEKNEREVQCWFFKTVVEAVYNAFQADPTLGDVFSRARIVCGQRWAADSIVRPSYPAVR
jgi:hypothetical protein